LVLSRPNILPSQARGPRACFDFPDGVDFGLQPVRADAQEAFLLRNTGNAGGRFTLSVPPPYAVTPTDGYLAAGGSMQASAILAQFWRNSAQFF
jgi:hypothetical protein